MDKLLGRYSNIIYAVLRIVVGLAFAVHGAQKLFGVLGGNKVPLLSLFGAAGVIELVCGVLVAVGLLTSWAAFLSSGQMAVAYFMIHLPKGFWPTQNGGEPALLYCFVFLYIASRGAGIWSVSRKT
jgi:putative oxidoreductase